VVQPAPTLADTRVGPPEREPVSPAAEMLGIITGFWVSRAVFAAARLGIADHLREGSRSLEELAAATGTHPPSLYRLLRALASVGVFVEDDHRRFALTPLAATLRTDLAGSLRHLAIAELGLDHYQAWEHLPYSIRTGDAAFEHRFGIPLGEYHLHQPESGELRRRALTGITCAAQAAILRSYDFSSFHIVVDVGGGQGALVAAILQAHPGLYGVLLERPEVRPDAERYLGAAGVGLRCAVAEGDLFRKVPSIGDAYLLMRILRGLDDGRALAVLQSCRRAIRDGGKLLVFESVVPDGGEPSVAKWLDLDALVMSGGRERTAADHRELLATAGFRLARIVPTDSILSIIEAVPV
jgi:hypothetical protein